MSKTRPKEKRRGGTRDDSWLTVDLNRCQLAALLARTRERCLAFQRKADQKWFNIAGRYTSKPEA